MNHRTIGIVAGLAILSSAGCGADCEAPTGTYDVTLVETSGDCGDLGITELGIPGSSTAPVGCTRQFSTDSDRCGASIDAQCATALNEAIVIAVEFDVSSDGTMIEGTYTYRQSDSSGALMCSSVYDFTGDKSP